MTQLADWMDQKEKSVYSDSVLEIYRNSGVKPTQAETDSSDYFGMLSDSTQQTFLETEVLLQSSEQLQSAYMRVMETYDKH